MFRTPVTLPNQFQDRVDAGLQLSQNQKLQSLDPSKSILLALPRGGLPVAYEIHKKTHIPLDLMIVRKLGVPFHPEVAMGALATGDIITWNEDLMRSLRRQLPESEIQKVVEAERVELNRRLREYRGDRPLPDVKGKDVVIVDDGIATGATVRAAAQSLRKQSPATLTIAVPVAPTDSIQELAKEVDDIICLSTPTPFHAVGLWYAKFPQTSDEEVKEIMDKVWVEKEE